MLHITNSQGRISVVGQAMFSLGQHVLSTFWPDPDQVTPVALLSSTHIYLEYCVFCTYMHFTLDISKPCNVDIINNEQR